MASYAPSISRERVAVLDWVRGAATSRETDDYATKQAEEEGAAKADLGSDSNVISHGSQGDKNQPGPLPAKRPRRSSPLGDDARQRSRRLADTADAEDRDSLGGMSQLGLRKHEEGKIRAEAGVPQSAGSPLAARTEAIGAGELEAEFYRIASSPEEGSSMFALQTDPLRTMVPAFAALEYEEEDHDERNDDEMERHQQESDKDGINNCDTPKGRRNCNADGDDYDGLLMQEDIDDEQGHTRRESVWQLLMGSSADETIDATFASAACEPCWPDPLLANFLPVTVLYALVDCGLDNPLKDGVDMFAQYGGACTPKALIGSAGSASSASPDSTIGSDAQLSRHKEELEWRTAVRAENKERKIAEFKAKRAQSGKAKSKTAPHTTGGGAAANTAAADDDNDLPWYYQKAPDFIQILKSQKPPSASDQGKKAPSKSSSLAGTTGNQR
jgi:hypothetical protein